jgi:hypothetical protein
MSQQTMISDADAKAASNPHEKNCNGQATPAEIEDHRHHCG